MPKVVSTINTGVNPAGIAITPSGKYAYVANNNNYSIAGQDTVTVIDLCANLPIKTIYHESFNEPYTITINNEGTRAYVTNSGGSTITVIDIETDNVIGIIDGFDGPSGLVIRGNIGYVNNYGATPGVGSGNGTTVRLVDLKENKIIGNPIIVGLAPAAITADSKYVYTVNYVDGNTNTGTLSKIDIKTNQVIVTIPGFSGPFAIVINGNKAYVTNFGSNNFVPFGTTISIVSLRTNTITSTITTGIQPSGIAVDGKYAYVTNYNTLYQDPVKFLDLTAGRGTVSVIDLKSNKVIGTIPVDQSPSYIVLTPNRKYACVTNYTSNSVNIIRLF